LQFKYYYFQTPGLQIVGFVLTGTACPAGQRGSRKATDTLRRRDKRKEEKKKRKKLFFLIYRVMGKSRAQSEL
jgi:hypothetical protein